MVIERKIWNISGVKVSNTNFVFKLGKEYFYSPEQSGPVSVGELPHEGARPGTEISSPWNSYLMVH